MKQTLRQSTIAVFLVLLTGCLSRNTYITGSGINKATFEEFVNNYLEAMCRGDSEFISTIIESDSYGRHLTLPEKPNLIACNLIIQVVDQFGCILPNDRENYRDPMRSFVVILADEGTGQKYEFWFYLAGNHIYLSHALEECYNPKNSKQGP